MGATSFARTLNKDTAHSGDPLEVVAFVDGLGRAIQARREVEVDDNPLSSTITTTVGSSVSGEQSRDARGRVTREGRSGFSTAPITSLVSLGEIHPTVTTFDPFSRVQRIDMPDGNAVQRNYGVEVLPGETEWRRSETTINQNLHQRTAFYNARGQIVAVRERATVQGALTDLYTRYRYDPLGRLIWVQDAAGHVTTAAYDSLGNMTRLDNPDTGETEWRFSELGELRTEQSPRLRDESSASGQWITYSRDRHRLHSIETPGLDPVVYSYGGPGAPGNGAGRFVERLDDSGSEIIEYGALGEVVRSKRMLREMAGTAALDADTRYHYDSFGRIQELEYPDGHHLFYEYDRGGNVSRVRGTQGAESVEYVKRITYDTQGRRVRMRRGNDVETRYAYDAAMERLTAVDSSNLASGSALQALRYYYTNTGNIRWLDNVLPSSAQAPLTGSIYQDFIYDEREQLTQAYATRYWDNDSQRRYTYAQSYDAIGNITHRTQEVAYRLGWSNPWVTEPSLTRDEAYQYASPRPHAFTQIGGLTASRDANGNLAGTQQGSTTLSANTWDHLNRLQSVDIGGIVVDHRYDASGERTHRRGPGSVTQYANGYYSVRNGAISSRHIFVSGERIASTVGEVGTLHGAIQTYHFHTDHLQSVQYVTDGDGTVREHLEYLPFGEPWIEEDNIPSELAYRFTGKEHDEETGLTYFGARYYDPRIAQWISPDPEVARYLTGAPAEGVFSPLNLCAYSYARNSPAWMADPDGRVAWWVPVVVGAATGLASGYIQYRASLPGASVGERSAGSLARSIDTLMLAASPFTGGGSGLATATSRIVVRHFSRQAAVQVASHVGASIVAQVHMSAANNGGDSYSSAPGSQPADSASEARPSRVSGGPEVTEQTIRDAMQDAPLSTQQRTISLPAVRRYVERLMAGDIPPPIRVDRNVIVDGNHRYIAGRILGREPPIQEWSGAAPERVVPWRDIRVDPSDWGNR